MYREIESPLKSVAAVHCENGDTEYVKPLMGEGVGVCAGFNPGASDTSPVEPVAKYDGFNFQ